MGTWTLRCRLGLACKAHADLEGWVCQGTGPESLAEHEGVDQEVHLKNHNLIGSERDSASRKPS